MYKNIRINYLRTQDTNRSFIQKVMSIPTPICTKSTSNNKICQIHFHHCIQNAQKPWNRLQDYQNRIQVTDLQKKQFQPSNRQNSRLSTFGVCCFVAQQLLFPVWDPHPKLNWSISFLFLLVIPDRHRKQHHLLCALLPTNKSWQIKSGLQIRIKFRGRNKFCNEADLITESLFFVKMES